MTLDALQVVAGNPTDGEILAVQLAFAHVIPAGQEPARPIEPGGWADPDESLRRAPAGTAAGDRYGWASTVW